MKLTIGLLVTVALLAGCTLPVSPTGAESDPGGNVVAKAYEVANMEGVNFISGECFSACTMELAYKGTCVEPQAVFGFHGSYLVPGLPNVSWRSWVVTGGDALLLSHYPMELQAWWLANARHRGPDDLAYLTGAQMLEAGWARACA